VTVDTTGIAVEAAAGQLMAAIVPMGSRRKSDRRD
jgi:hypothetical protein